MLLDSKVANFNRCLISIIQLNMKIVQIKFFQIHCTDKVMIHYLKNKVGVVDFANAQGPAGFETLPLRGLL